jgi:pimeloyl-ACP methyl ester carboxylesterase
MRNFLVLLLSVLSVSVFTPNLCAQQSVTLTARWHHSLRHLLSRARRLRSHHPPLPSGGLESLGITPIAPVLNSANFSSLAIDARHGGDMWGHKNETVVHLGHEGTYLESLVDLEAALAWARKQNRSRKIIVWGSSYFACLVFVLAAKHPGEIVGLLSFSPAEYLQNKSPVHDAAVKVNIPVFITSAKGNEEEESARSIFSATADERDRVLFVPRTAGVHHVPEVSHIEQSWEPACASMSGSRSL